MIAVLNNILKFITDPKNTRMILLGGIVILILLQARQCNQTKYWKQQIEIQKQETKRIANNYEAAMDTIKTYKVDGDTWRSEKLGYELTLEELKGKYSTLLGDFKIEKNKPPKTIVRTEFLIKDSIHNVPILVEIDSLGRRFMAFSDSVHHDSANYRFLNGRIPYEITFDPIDSVYKLKPSYGQFDLTIGMNLNLGIFQDKKTRKIMIKADTDYPGVKFTMLEGASIMDNPANRKTLRTMRKTWGVGINLGYGFLVNPSSGIINTGPYFGLGVSYSPKFLQWGR